MSELLQKAVKQAHSLSRDERIELLSLKDTSELFAAALEVKRRWTGLAVSLRGLVELSNYCAKNCLYCGIRSDNRDIVRYRISEEDAIRMARWSFERGYGSIVLQSGELESEENTAYIERIIRGINAFAGDSLGITLCLGEQSEEVYRRWLEAGAHRYLLRIETSNPRLYTEIHPDGYSFERRVECLRSLTRLGYQTGSGVMIGLPGQSVADLADDIEFFRALDLDMIGMGPWLPHHDTPLGKEVFFSPEEQEEQLRLGLKMIAVTRLYLHDVNIAATTALQALRDDGREQGLLAGANVLMPNVTDIEHRKNYQLYENKPCLDENSEKCRNCLASRVLAIGEQINWGKRGDPPHFHRRLAR
jgi:biotin synthase